MIYNFREIVIDSRTGLNPRKNFVLGNGNNYYITIKDIHDGKIIITDKTDRVDDDAIAIIKKRSRIKNGDILFTSIGRVGETAIVTNKDDSWDVNESVFVFTINPDIIIAEYFCLLFQSKDIRERLTKGSTGSTFKSIKMNQLERMTFDIPPIGEQRKLVSKANVLKAIINDRNNQLTQLDLLVKARFVELFGECKAKKPLAEICSIITDGTHQPPKFQSFGIPFIFVSNLADNKVTYNAEKFIDENTYNELIKRTPIEKGDILLSTVGSYGHPAVVIEDRKFLFQRHIAYLKPNHNLINSFYMHSALLSPDAQRQIEDRVKGIAQKTLNLSEIRKINIPLPNMKQQEQFAAFAEQIDKSKVVFQYYMKRGYPHDQL